MVVKVLRQVGTLLVVDNSFAIEQYKNQLIVSTFAGVEQQQIPDRNTGDTKFTLVSSRIIVDTYWYLRWWDGQNNLSSGGNYSLQH